MIAIFITTFVLLVGATRYTEWTEPPLEPELSWAQKRAAQVRLRDMWQAFRYGRPTDVGIEFSLGLNQKVFELFWIRNERIHICLTGITGPDNYLILGKSVGAQADWLELQEHFEKHLVKPREAQNVQGYQVPSESVECITNMTIAAFETGKQLAYRVPREYVHFELCPTETVELPMSTVSGLCFYFWRTRGPEMGNPAEKFVVNTTLLQLDETLVVRESLEGWTVQGPPHVRLFASKTTPTANDHGVLIAEPTRFEDRVYILVTSHTSNGLVVRRTLVLQAGERKGLQLQSTAVWSAVGGAISLAAVLIWLFGPKVHIKAATSFGVLALLFIAVSITSRLLADKSHIQVD